jgi:hypothetical protein
MIKNIIIITLILLCITLIAIKYLYNTILGRLLLFLFIICIILIDKTLGILISAYILSYYTENNLEGFTNKIKLVEKDSSFETFDNIYSKFNTINNKINIENYLFR